MEICIYVWVMENIRLGCSPITGTIFAGKLNKAGTMWLKKEDVTNEATNAVAEHLLTKGESMEFIFRGVKYLLEVKPL